LSFEEKPQQPKFPWGVPALYIYKQETLPLIRKYLEEGNNPDAPGHFVPWLIKHKPIYAFQFEGQWYDIGTFESYEEAQAVFAV
ncbi:MAG TPA: nucleotidyltransferase family protein, partial [Firmicutes bacterium]|nr:nucleotidyltransferase family protein [Bacillota bacterium]